MILKFSLLRTAACFAAAVALTVTTANAAHVVLDTYDANAGSPTHGGFRSITWTEPDTMTNNPGDTRGGQAFGFFNGNLVDASSTGLSDASGANAVMSITITEEIGNELPGLGMVMLADSADRRWIFEFDNFATGSLGNPATSAQTFTIVSNANSGRDAGQGTNDGNDFDFSQVGKASGQAYWIQPFNLQQGGGAHPINFTLDEMSLANAVPEPASLALVALGGVLVLGLRRKA